MVKDRVGGNLSLDQYIADRNFCINYPLYTDLQGNLMVDRVLKYKNLNDELSDLFTKVGVPFNGTLGVWAKSEHRRDKTPLMLPQPVNSTPRCSLSSSARSARLIFNQRLPIRIHSISSSSMAIMAPVWD
jgi:hypothetical protein